MFSRGIERRRASDGLITFNLVRTHSLRTNNYKPHQRGVKEYCHLEKHEDVVVDVLMIGAVQLEGASVHLDRLIGHQTTKVFVRIKSKSTRYKEINKRKFNLQFLYIVV